jgi:hypothetical protein
MRRNLWIDQTRIAATRNIGREADFSVLIRRRPPGLLPDRGVGNLRLGKSRSTITSVHRPPLPPGTERGGPRAAPFRKADDQLRFAVSPSLLHLQHETRCGSHGIYLPIRANDATLGGYSSVSSVGYMCLRA